MADLLSSVRCLPLGDNGTEGGESANPPRAGTGRLPHPAELPARHWRSRGRKRSGLRPWLQLDANEHRAAQALVGAAAAVERVVAVAPQQSVIAVVTEQAVVAVLALERV